MHQYWLPFSINDKTSVLVVYVLPTCRSTNKAFNARYINERVMKINVQMYYTCISIDSSTIPLMVKMAMVH